MLLLGIDLGTSSVKVSVVDGSTGNTLSAAQYPDSEATILSLQPGWAEQHPADWWMFTQEAIKRCLNTDKFKAKDISAIGIAYQMHGLVMIDRNIEVIRPSIIWCDSRAVSFGEEAFKAIGTEQSLSHLLNSPGNFTASKLAWVKANEPRNYGSIYKIMLPGDYIATRLTGSISTSVSSLSEGIFWDFKTQSLSADVLRYFGFPETIFPNIKPVFSEHGQLSSSIADSLGLKAGIPVTYKAGDQPNNALSLNVLEPGEVAATAGTSGVVYAVTDKVSYDPLSRVNTFAHVNHQHQDLGNRLGVLLCINGTGILNRWARDTFGASLSYPRINALAAQAPVGAEGLQVFPFGNGAERVLQNKTLGAQFSSINFNIHTQAHIFRGVQEGIAFALNYGLKVMASNGTQPSVIRAGKANMFLSEVFAQSLVNASGVSVELYDTDGSKGAALGAGIGLGYFGTPQEAFSNMKKIGEVNPDSQALQTQEAYQSWEEALNKMI
jgi:xylulokinase